MQKPLRFCKMWYNYVRYYSHFGDGFSNVFYPTNPVLLIGLGLADMSYTKWAKWSGKFQILNLILTRGLLLFGLAIGYC